MKRIDVILYFVAGLLLLIPYGIKVMSNKLEPYPAVILPDGSSTVVYNDEYITYSRIELMGLDAISGRKRVINLDLFFDPIPSNRIYAFINNSFGLDEVRTDTFRFRRNIISPIIIDKHYKNTYHQELILWYKNKLRAQGLQDSIFMFQEEMVKIDISTNEVLDSVLLRSENYLLND